jgi:succinate dehydrogenase/fumarate reductase-like Fe-S protein
MTATQRQRVITAKVYRFNPESEERARFETYDVPYEEGWSVMNVLQYIYENMDPTLSHYYSCRIGRCGGCHLFVNGRAVQSCCTHASEEMVIEPPHRIGLRVIKDLIASDIFLTESKKASLPHANALTRFTYASDTAKGKEKPMRSTKT